MKRVPLGSGYVRSILTTHSRPRTCSIRRKRESWVNHRQRSSRTSCCWMRRRGDWTAPMSSKKPRHSSGPPPRWKRSEVRPAVAGEEHRRADRWSSDAEIEILSPVRQTASALNVSRTGIQLSLDHWLSAGTICDLHITTRHGRTLLKRARVIWTRREGERCVSGLEVMGSLSPPADDRD